MRFWLKYLQTWLIIKKKTYGKYISKSNDHYTKFAIVCAPRSGSNWLHTLLNFHPQIISKGEILRITYENHTLQNIPPLKELVFHPQASSICAVGLKLFYQYLNDSTFDKSFQEVQLNSNISIIHLIRKNVLAQYTSLMKAKKSQQWSQSRAINNHQPIHIDFDNFTMYQKNLLLIQNKIHEAFKNHPLIEIYYEDLVEHPEKTLTDLQKFLNVKPKRLFSLLHKQSTTPLKDQISNWSDFKDKI